MTVQPVFDPTRSAQIRELLIQTVEADTARPSRRVFGIVAALTGVALALAGGTAALALTGLLHFGSGDPQPAPPSSTQTPTPTSTPTPSSTPSARAIALQTSPIARHDVDSVPATPSWAVDLPGSNDFCSQHHVYDIAEGLALFQVGAKVVGDSDEGCDEDHQEVALSLVDTTSGTILWSRDWKWDARPLWDVDVIPLGMSGRVLVVDQGLGGGPHEVIDLKSGATIGDFPAQIVDFSVDVIAVPDASGDVVMATKTGAVRIDPLDSEHPRWTVASPSGPLYLHPLPSDPMFLPVSYQVKDAPNPNGYGTIDLATGAFTVEGSYGDFLYAQGATVALSDYASYRVPRMLTGLSPSGERLWTFANTTGGDAAEVQSINLSTPGRSTNAGTGLITLISLSRVTLVDGSTGATRWSADAERCEFHSTFGTEPPIVAPYLDEAKDRLIILYDGHTCSFSASTGAPDPIPDTPAVPGTSLPFLGPDNTYLLPSYDAGTAVGFDRESGRELWRTDTEKGESWIFAGGYLVRVNGTHLESVG